MKQIMMLLAAMLLTACSKDDEVKAATVQEAGKTLLVYYSYTNNCLYYDTNTWTFTRIGKIEGKTQAELKQILKARQGNITVTLSLSSGTTAINGVRSAAAEAGTYYSLNGQRVNNPTKGIFIKNGKKVIL